MNKLKWFFAVMILIVASTINAAINYGTVTVSQVISVYDGDTICVNIDEYPAIIGKNIRVRLARIDAPEMKTKTKKAIKARDFVKSILKSAKEIKLGNIKRDKYFRIGAEIYADGKNLSDLLLKKRLVKSIK